MKKIKFLTLSVIVLLFFYACPKLNEVDSAIKIVNNSSKDVYHWLSFNDPELSWKPNENFLLSPNSTYVEEGNFYKILSDGSKIYIWIFDRQVIDTVPWEQVKENDMYLKRYEFTLQDLEAMNWQVIFDGN